MAIDIVVPVYNGAHLVGRAIRSALAQDALGAATIICIDDRSSDDSWRILTELAQTDDRITLLRQDANLGVAAARNRAVRAGTSPLIAFLDQDDEWIPGSLGARLTALTDDPSLGYVTGLQQVELDPGAVRPAWCRPEWLERPQPGQLPSALVVRREVFLEVGFLDEKLGGGADDFDWFARSRRMGIPNRMLDEVVCIRHVHDTNASATPETDAGLLAAVRRHVDEKRGRS